MQHDYFNPPELFSTQGFGFTQVVKSGPGKTIHVSGQTAWNADRKLVGGNDLALQTKQALENLRVALAAGGAGPRDVVSVRVYMVGYEPAYAGVVGPLLEAFFDGGQPPAATWLGVSALAVPGFLIEVEATAVVDA